MRFGTGWIFLGVRIRNGYRWGNQKDDGWTQTSFNFVAPPNVPGDSRLPRKGDLVRLTDRSRIHIADYAMSGEEHRLVSPLAKGRLSRNDETRLWLAAGATVQLADVQIKWAGDMALVLGRVVPAVIK